MYTFYLTPVRSDELYHYGRLGMKWGEHRFAAKATRQAKKNARNTAKLYGGFVDQINASNSARAKRDSLKYRLKGDNSKRDQRLQKKINKWDQRLKSSKDRQYDLFNKYKDSYENGQKYLRKLFNTPGLKDKYVTSLSRATTTRGASWKDSFRYMKEHGKPYKPLSSARKEIDYDYTRVRRKNKLTKAIADRNQIPRGYKLRDVYTHTYYI